MNKLFKKYLRSGGLLLAAFGIVASLIIAATHQASAATYSMWTNATVPQNPSENDNAAVELGVKFRSSTAGQVTGVRFYKGTGNTGTHIGNLWSRTGTKLASATFTNETATGWQKVTFANPVAITANTTYVASYFAPKGHYAEDENYFASSATTNGPLTFLKNGSDGGNGVYRYGARSGFPARTFASANYWVDVVFNDSSSTVDTTPPTVGVVSPVDGASGIAVNDAVVATFSEALAPATVSAATATLRNVSGGVVAASVAYNSANRQVTITPNASLAMGTTYTATLTTGITDVAGNNLATNYTWSFTTAVPVDTTPPAVSSVTPTAGATGVSSATAVSAVFSEGLAPATVTAGTFTVSDSQSVPVIGTVGYDEATQTVGFVPGAALVMGTTYTATLTTGITDVAGNNLATNYSWSFTVAPAASPVDPLAQGHGGPILVVTSSAAPINNYYSEILRAEGLNSFSAVDINDLSATVLGQYDVVLLGNVPLSASQVSALTSWVNQGGNLVAMHPDKQLAGLLGLTDQDSTLSEAYLKVDTSRAPGAGIVGDTLQFHGTADRYAANAGTKIVASLYANATTATANPAVTIRQVGTNGGHAAAFTYDLATSVTRSHQGNPAWAATNRDDYATIRPDDLYYGASTTDPQSDYINLDKVAIPQADEQQRLLANLIADVNKDKKPLAKFWYFPNGKKAVVVMVGDDHQGGGAGPTFDAQIAASPAGCSVDDWECVRSTALMYTSSTISQAQATAYSEQGFEMGLHINPPNETGVATDSGCGFWSNGNVSWLGSQFDSQLSSWRAMYPNLPNQTTTRNHCAVWSDYASSAKAEATRGLRVDLNYYYWPGSWLQNRPGYFTGSGLPMRFVDSDGAYIDVYQVPSELVNENGTAWPAGIATMLDRAIGPEGYYGAIGTHYDYRGDNFETMLVQQAQQRGIPLVSGKQIQTWTDARNNSYYSNEAWSGSTYTFSATVDPAARSMMNGMVPFTTAKGTLSSMTKDGAPLTFTTQTIKGVQYAFFAATSGTYAAVYTPDTAPPTVASVAPASGTTGVSVTSPVTVSFSEPLDPATVSNNSIEVLSPAGASVPGTITYDTVTSTATFTPDNAYSTLTPYTLRVHGSDLGTPVKDLSGNALSSTYTSIFTVGIVELSLWAPAAPTYTLASGDTAQVELGLRFSSSQPGTITGIRFYKANNDAATHTVTLWDNDGNALATAATASESAIGWQTATFSAPVAVTPGATYTASYNLPTGRYPFTYTSLSSAFANGPLTALANGGVYRYGTGFPTSAFNGSNYWVDVVFAP